MEGIVVRTTYNKETGQNYGVLFGDTVFPVLDFREVDIRMLTGGETVTFITDRETGDAILIAPPPIIGCEG